MEQSRTSFSICQRSLRPFFRPIKIKKKKIRSLKIEKKKKYILFFFHFNILISLIGCKSSTLISINGENITYKDFNSKLKIEKAYDNKYSDTLGIIFSLIQESWREKIANDIGIRITREKIKEESERINRNTKDSQILSRVKDVFSRNQEGYLQRYVKPVLIERLLQNKFFFDTLYQKKPWKRINKAYNKVKKDKEPDTLVRNFFPDNPNLLSYYKQFENEVISEDKNDYFFIKKNKDNIEVYVTPKNDFTKWFRKKVTKYPVKIYNDKLKENMKKRIKDNEFWKSVIL